MDLDWIKSETLLEPCTTVRLIGNCFDPLFTVSLYETLYETLILCVRVQEENAGCGAAKLPAFH